MLVSGKMRAESVDPVIAGYIYKKGDLE